MLEAEVKDFALALTLHVELNHLPELFHKIKLALLKILYQPHTAGIYVQTLSHNLLDAFEAVLELRKTLILEILAHKGQGSEHSQQQNIFLETSLRVSLLDNLAQHTQKVEMVQDPVVHEFSKEVESVGGGVEVESGEFLAESGHDQSHHFFGEGCVVVGDQQNESGVDFCFACKVEDAVVKSWRATWR